LTPTVKPSLPLLPPETDYAQRRHRHAQHERQYLRKAFGGSVGKLMIRAVEDGDLNPEELKEIQKLIDTVRKAKRGRK
jgi:hypothetical protein